MKRPIQLLVLLFLLAPNAFSQEFKKPSPGKSLVYFVRISGTGALINFKYFDGERYLGKMNGVNYFMYECDPGKHVFWVAAENRDFLNADLKPDATYIVEVQPTMGAFKAAVQLHAVSPGDPKKLKKVNRIIANNTPSELKGREEDMAFFIKNGLERYEKIKNEVPAINQEWTF